MRVRKAIVRLMAVLLVLLALGLIAAQVEDPTDLTSVLTWLAFGGGGVWVTNQFVSLFLENTNWWHTLKPGVKIGSTLVVSVLLGLGAGVLLPQPDTIAIIQPYYKIVILAVLGWIGSQVAYMRTKALRAGTGPSGYGAQNR